MLLTIWSPRGGDGGGLAGLAGAGCHERMARARTHPLPSPRTATTLPSATCTPPHRDVAGETLPSACAVMLTTLLRAVVVSCPVLGICSFTAG